jgi:hypothetical protein
LLRSSIFDCFEEEESVLSDIEIDVMVGFVRDVRSEVSADECVPVAIVLSVEFVLEVGGDLLNCVHFVEGVLGDGQNLRLHLRTDVLALYDRPLLSRLRH